MVNELIAIKISEIAEPGNTGAASPDSDFETRCTTQCSALFPAEEGLHSVCFGRHQSSLPSGASIKQMASLFFAPKINAPPAAASGGGGRRPGGQSAWKGVLTRPLLRNRATEKKPAIRANLSELLKKQTPTTMMT